MRVEITVTSDPFVNAALDSRDTGLFLLRTIRIRNNGGHIRDAHLRLRTTPFIVEFNSPVDVQIPAGKELTIPVGDLIETSPHWQDLPDTYISKLQVELLTDDGFVRATSDVYNVRLLTGNTWPGCANRDLLAAFVIPDQPSLRRDAEPLGRVVGGTTPEDAAASIVRILRKRKMVRKPLPGDMFRRPYRFVLYEEMTVADGCTSVDMALAFAAMAEAVGLEPVIGVFADGMMVGIRTSPGGTWGDSVVPVDPDLIFGGCRPSEIVARSRKASKGPLDSMVDVASLRDRISPIPMALLEHGMRTYISADTMERKPPLRYLTWMSRLLDISLNNSLLDMGPRTVRFDVSDQGQVDSLQDVLLSGTEVKTRYASPTVGGFDGVRIAMDRSHGDRMEAFRRSISSNIREAGVGGGCMGLGSMHWTDRKGRTHEAPLVLVSADLRKLNEHGYALRHPDLEDAAVNIVLLERLRRETGAVTPRAEEFSSNGRIDITGLASRLSSIPGVGYRPTVVFGEFGLETNEMWRDLESNSRDILSNPLVGRLAECRQLDHMGALEPDYDMSDLHPVLPVDSSQIAAMNAAVSGRSFVLRGPPGTGKSQTICNIICELVRRRRTVLFVSQKASALEIIHRRLSKIGLGGFCIGVYGKTAKRSAVVEQLRDNLNDRGSDGPPEEVIQSPVSTDALDRYYEAMFGDSGRGDSFYVKYNRYLASLSTESVIPEPGDDAKGYFGSSMEALDSLISGIPDDDLFTMISVRDLSDDLLRGACGMKVNPLRSASKKCREFSEILRRCGIGDEVRIGEIGSLATDLVKLSSLGLKPSDRDAHDRRAVGVRNAVKAVRTACGDVCDLTPGDDVAHAMGRLRSALFELMTRNGRSEDVSRHLGTTESLIREIAGTVPETSWEERMASTDPRTAAIADGVRNSGRNPEELYRMLTYCSDFMAETFPGTDGNPFQHADVMGKLDFIMKEWDSRLSVRDARKRVDSTRGLLDEADRLMGDMKTRIREWTPCTDLGGRISSLLDGCDGMYEDGFMTARLDATGLMKAMLDVFEAGLQYDEAVKASDRIWNKGVYRRLHEYRDRMVSLKGHSVVNRLNGSISEFMREIDGHSRVRMRFGDVSVNLETAMNARRAHDRVLERIVGFGKVREETEGRMSKLLETADRVERIQGTIPEWRRLLIDGTYSDQKVRKDLEGHCRSIKAAFKRMDVPARGMTAVDFGRLTGLVGSLVSDSETSMQLGGIVERCMILSDEVTASLTHVERELDEVSARMDRTHPDTTGIPMGCTSMLQEHAEEIRDAAWGCISALEPYDALVSKRLRSGRIPLSEVTDRLSLMMANVKGLKGLQQFVGMLRNGGEGFEESVLRVLGTVPGSELAASFDRWFMGEALDRELGELFGIEDYGRGILSDYEAKVRESYDRMYDDNASNLGDVLRNRAFRASGDPSLDVLSSKDAPLSAIMDSISHLLPDIAPCFVMNVQSVSRFLGGSSVTFDYVIFDESSQIPVADSISSMSKGDSCIIVGDVNQLPPTTFFRNTAGEGQGGDETESILEECIYRDMPTLFLDWHYRSNHESLIAYSNGRFYDNRLITFPSVTDRVSRVEFRYVEDGNYARGEGYNTREAEAVVDEVYRLHDLGVNGSIGIVTFGTSQKEEIEGILARRQAVRPLRHNRREPLFVGNLESIQGEERDIILISVGYGRDSNGRLSMNFGPLNQGRGWRRLNVAISRARDRMIVFSSMRPSELRVNDNTGRGVRELKGFLEYAESGVFDRRVTSADIIDPILPDVAGVVEGMGYETSLNIGKSELRIDVAVVDPADPDRYCLAILLDRNLYDNSRNPVDRDYTKMNILRKMGWRVLRVHTIDWMIDRDAVVDRIERALPPTKTG